MPEAFDHAAFFKPPDHPSGVYQMYDSRVNPLRRQSQKPQNRVSSYFQKPATVKTQVLVKRIASITITVTPSEAEALVLEQNLIKAQRPPFNVMLRDDKSYPIFFYPRANPTRAQRFIAAPKTTGRLFCPFPAV